MISALAAAVLCAFVPPKAGLTVGEAVKLSPEKIESAVQLIATELLASELPTRLVESRCSGDPQCLAAAAQRDQVWALGVLTLAMAKADVLVDLEVYKVDGWVSLGHVTFQMKKGKLDDAQSMQLAELARQTRQAAPQPPPEKVETPVSPPPVEPVEAPKVAVEVAPEPVRRSHLGPILTGIGAGLAAGASVGFGILGSNEKTQLAASPDGMTSTLTRTQAISLRDSANGHFTVSLATGIAAGALLLTSVLWLVLFE
ncbi:MAG: hypothetical protein QM723_05685 [Myxococcaceae bacterium]